MSQPILHHAAASSHPQGRRRMDRVIDWLNEPARRLHCMLHGMPGFQQLRHVSLSIYDGASDLLWSFSVSDTEPGRPEVQEVDMADAPSLVLLADGDQPRIVDDLAEFGDESRFHSTGARNAGCRSCMTVPIHYEGEFLGFVIFGAAVPNFFRAEVIEVVQTYSEAFAILISRAGDVTALAN